MYRDSYIPYKITHADVQPIKRMREFPTYHDSDGINVSLSTANRLLTRDKHAETIPCITNSQRINDIHDDVLFAAIEDGESSISLPRQHLPFNDYDIGNVPIYNDNTYQNVNRYVDTANAEPFTFSYINGKPTLTMTDNEYELLTSTKEGFSCGNCGSTYSKDDHSIMNIATDAYLDTLKTRAMAVCFYLNTNKSYAHWSENWKLLERNLKKSRMLFDKLDRSDADIAYVVNKGEEVRFRIHDNKRFIPLNIYQYVLYHEMAHMSTHELQHPPKFHELLNVISLAAFELGFIDLKRIQFSFYLSNGQPILCKASLKSEITEGCDWLIKMNPTNAEYFRNLKSYVKSR